MNSKALIHFTNVRKTKHGVMKRLLARISNDGIDLVYVSAVNAKIAARTRTLVG